MLPIERLDQVELFALLDWLQSLVAEVRHDGFGDRNFCRSDGGALVHGRQERAAVVLYSAMAAGRRNRDERRQVFVIAPEAIADPGADARPNEIGLTGVQS